MICEKCNAENPDGSKYCVICGNPFEINSEDGSMPLAPYTELGPIRNRTISKLIGSPYLLYVIAAVVFVLIIITIITAYLFGREDNIRSGWDLTLAIIGSLGEGIFWVATLVGVTGFILLWRKIQMRHITTLPKILYTASLIVLVSKVAETYNYVQFTESMSDYYNYYNNLYWTAFWCFNIATGLFHGGILIGLGMLISNMSVEKEKTYAPSVTVYKNMTDTKSSEIKCPTCKNTVQGEWNYCPECKEYLNEYFCSLCGAVVEPDWNLCPYCEGSLDD